MYMANKKCCICNRENDFQNLVVLEGGTIVCKDCAVKIAGSIGYRKVVSNGPASVTQAGKRADDFTYSTDTFTGNRDFPVPREIKAYLDRFVVGQEEAKKVLSVAAYNHYKRMKIAKPGIQKSNVLMIGPTGSGKTYLMKTLAKTLDVPLAIVSATNLTETGYVGEDVTTIVEALLSAAGGDVEKAQHGIIFIDEIDKLAVGSSASKSQVGGKGVQQALLPIIEGNKVMVSIGKQSSAPYKVEVDTTNVLFVCGGAFPDMEEIIKKRLGGKASIGFVSGGETDDDAPEKNLLLHATNDDLKEFGFIPEFLGRLPVLATLEELSEETLKRILQEPEDSIIKQYKELFAFDGITLEFEEGTLGIIARKAIKAGTGARSLRSALESLLLDLQFYTPGTENRRVVITEDFANGIGAPILSTY